MDINHCKHKCCQHFDILFCVVKNPKTVKPVLRGHLLDKEKVGF